MKLEIINIIYFPILIAISISKPISDYFWLRKYKTGKGIYGAIVTFLNIIWKKQYILLMLFGMFLWGLSSLIIHYHINNNFALQIIIYSIATSLFIAATIVSIKSILVVCLISVTFANFGLINLFYPLTKVSDLSTLNSFLSNLISVFNYAALATFAVGALWNFSRHNDEEVYSTISTMFYSICYIALNMFFAFVMLFIPTIEKISILAK